MDKKWVLGAQRNVVRIKKWYKSTADIRLRLAQLLEAQKNSHYMLTFSPRAKKILCGKMYWERRKKVFVGKKIRFLLIQIAGMEKTYQQNMVFAHKKLFPVPI